MSPTGSGRRGAEGLRGRASVAVGVAALAGVSVLALAVRPARADAVAGHLELRPARLSFSTPGESHALTLTNTGGAPLHTGNLSFVTAGGRGSSFIVDEPAARTLAPGASAVLNVTFHPLVGAAPPQAFGALLVPADDPRLPLDVDLRTGAAGSARVAGVELVARETQLLTWIVFLPLLGAALIGLGAARASAGARAVALLAAGLPLALAVVVVARFDPTTAAADGNYGAQLVAHAPLVRALGLEYFVGVDGLSVLLVLLAPAVGLAAVVAARASAADARRTWAPLLVAQAGATGVFVALDGLLLWLFWLLAVVAIVALQRGRAFASGRLGPPPFMWPGLASAALLLLAIVALARGAGPTYLCDGTPATRTFDLLKLARANDFAAKAAAGAFGLSRDAIVWAGLFVAFVLAMGVPPFGSSTAGDPSDAWGPLVGVVSNMGLYGLLRFNLSLLPETTRAAGTFMATFGAVAALVAALLATRATDLRRLFARAGAARTALGVLGLAALTPAGISGVLAVALAGGLAVALVLALAGGPWPGLLDGAAAGASPRLARWLVFALLASLAAPGLATFVGPALVVLDASTRHPLAAVAALVALVVGAGAHARALRPLFARAVAAASATARDVDGAALAVAVPAALLLIVLGLAPRLALDAVATGVLDLVRLAAAARG
jgi:NADH-quinone oxidoreductase subunit M